MRRRLCSLHAVTREAMEEPWRGDPTRRGRGPAALVAERHPEVGVWLCCILLPSLVTLYCFNSMSQLFHPVVRKRDALDVQTASNVGNIHPSDRTLTLIGETTAVRSPLGTKLHFPKGNLRANVLLE